MPENGCDKSRANPVQGGSKEYVVIRGDTLFKIARANGVKFSALTNANPNLNLSKLKAGQKIQIPTAAASASTGIGYGSRKARPVTAFCAGRLVSAELLIVLRVAMHPRSSSTRRSGSFG